MLFRYHYVMVSVCLGNLISTFGLSILFLLISFLFLDILKFKARHYGENHDHISMPLLLLLLLLCLPPTGSGDILFFLRASVRPSVCLSVCPPVRHKSCPLYNLKTVKDFSMKLGTLVNHDETMRHAQES